MSSFKKPGFQRWDTPHPDMSHDLVSHVQKQQNFQQVSGVSDEQASSIVAAPVPDKQVPVYTVTADEALQKPKQVGGLQPIAEHSAFSQSEVTDNLDTSVCHGDGSNASQPLSPPPLQRQISLHGDRDPEQSAIPSENLLDRSSSLDFSPDQDAVDSAMDGPIMTCPHQTNLQKTPPGPETRIWSTSEKEEERLPAVQLQGHSLPPSAFAAHGDPLMPVDHRTTDADTELAQHSYGSPPSAHATHGDPAQSQSPFKRDLYATNLTAQHTAAYPDKLGYRFGVEPADPLSNSSLAAAADNARNATRASHSHDLRTLGGELKPGQHGSTSAAHILRGHGNVPHAGDMLPYDNDSPLNKIGVHRVRSASDERSAHEVLQTEGQGNPESVRPVRKFDARTTELVNGVISALAHDHPSRVAPMNVGTNPRDVEDSMPESSP